VTGRPGLDEKAAVPRVGLDLCRQRVGFGGVHVLELCFLLVERLLPEGFGQLFPQRFHQLLHQVPEPTATPGGEGDGAGRIGMGKVMHVHPIARGRPLGGLLRDPAAQRFKLFCPGEAGDEDVEPTAAEDRVFLETSCR